MIQKNHTYKVFELEILSTNIELPELQRSEKNVHDVEIIKSSRRLIKSQSNYKKIYKNLFINENELVLNVSNIAVFKVESGNKIFWNNYQSSFSEDSIRAYLLGSAMGAILIQRGNIVIHANALTKDSKTIICAGNGGDGKSTLAYSLMRQGWKLLSDDLVALSDDFCVLPGIPRIKLWDDAISYYGIEKNYLKRVREDMKKYQLTGDCVKSAYKKSKVNAIYVLNNEENIIVKNEILSQKEKFLKVHNHIYRPLYVNGFNKEANYFKKLTKLTKDLPVYNLSLPRSISSMDNWLSENSL